ncbi:hypothetical protein [Brevundimonas subvibrioides]|uniref:hypothetical protein n=1 Tax=Brevundimonas subvibrioides TaxID=74313 RepID=UPI0022B3F7D5|nr:hypothetical protein [Brevundimonas subvibrioides]
MTMRMAAMVALGLGLALPMAAAAQTAPAPAPAPAPRGVPVEAPILEGATLDPTCGGLYGLEGRAFCVTASLANIGALADAYISHFESLGWIAAGGDDNRVVFVKRKDGGGCDGIQLEAFYNTNRPAVAEAPGYIGVATIPGDICTAAPPSTPAPVTPSAP